MRSFSDQLPEDVIPHNKITIALGLTILNTLTIIAVLGFAYIHNSSCKIEPPIEQVQK